MSEPQWNGSTGDRWVESQALMDAILAPFADALFEAAQLPDTGAVVDVGCGCGATTLIAARGRPNLQIVGVDLSQPMLARARQRAQAEDLTIRFEHGDATTAQPLPEGVDRVVSRFGVMFFDDPAAAFANIRRWLTPGGTLTATVWSALADNAWMTDIIALLRRHVDWAPAPTARGPFSLADPAHVDTLLHDAGFIGVEQLPLDLPMRIPGSVDDAVRFHCDRTIVQSALVDVEPRVRQAVHDDLRAFVQARHDGHAITLGARARLVRAGT